jgi:hypothetical protein
MKRFTKDDIEYIKSNYGKISGVAIAKNLDRSYGSVKNKIRLLGICDVSIGSSKFSRSKRKYSVDDNFFSTPNILNSYWAGFISADGCLHIKNDVNKKLSIYLSIKDLNHLERFKRDIKSEISIKRSIHNGKFESCSITIQSIKIVEDLYKNFCLTPQKTHINKFPNLFTNELDSFIIGYIDGDGSLSIRKKSGGIILSLIGTLEMCEGIKKRCSEILGRICGSVSKNRNMYSLTFGEKASRELVSYFKKINVPYLSRKWNKKIVVNKIGYHRKKSIQQIDIKSMECIAEFSSQSEANLFLNINPRDTSICNCLAGRIKKAHGFYWKFV